MRLSYITAILQITTEGKVMGFYAYDNGDGIDGIYIGKDIDDIVDNMFDLFEEIVDDDWKDLLAGEDVRPEDEAAWKSSHLAEQLANFRSGLVAVVPTKADLSELVICDERYIEGGCHGD